MLRHCDDKSHQPPNAHLARPASPGPRSEPGQPCSDSAQSRRGKITSMCFYEEGRPLMRALYGFSLPRWTEARFDFDDELLEVVNRGQSIDEVGDAVRALCAKARAGATRAE